ncbi:MAG: hypothetical protein KDB14_35120 [Planctomycetales bacterium]|nr:hypothetical protein [Planctomycetales bacterium]
MARKLINVPTEIEIVAGGNETHCLNLTGFLLDGQSVTAASVSEVAGTELLTISGATHLTSTFTSRTTGSTVASGKGASVNIAAGSTAGSGYIEWSVTLTDGDDPKFRQKFCVL